MPSAQGIAGGVVKSLIAGIAGLALMLGAAGVAAQDTAYVPTLSTSAQRVCTSEQTQTIVSDRRTGTPLGQPAVSRSTSRFHATARQGGGYLFMLGFDSPSGDIDLQASITRDGSVSAAEINGSALAYLTDPDERERQAMFMARDIPETALVGRRFTLGDSYYSASATQALLDAIIGRLDTPFPLRGTMDITYRGAGMAQGRASRDFAGTITIEGGGTLQGTQVELRYSGQFAFSHDAETGLILTSRSDHRSGFTQNGVVAHDSISTDVVTCEIRPL